MTYLPELEALWRQNKEKEKRSWRPGTLRGRVFFDALVHFHLATGDKIFGEAAMALFKYGAIDGKGKFTAGWEAPDFAKIQMHIELDKVLCIRLEIKGGRTPHRACAEVAARTGHPASSFAAAIKNLKNKYKRNAELGLPTDDAFRLANNEAIKLYAESALHWDEVMFGR
jgi:hypothetical protein